MKNSAAQIFGLIKLIMQNNKQIAYILGTKAQFIKSKFILKYLIDEGYEMIVLDTGQHRLITKREL